MKRKTLAKWLVFGLCFVIHFGIQLYLMWRVPQYAAHVYSASKLDRLDADDRREDFPRIRQHHAGVKDNRGSEFRDRNGTLDGKSSSLIISQATVKFNNKGWQTSGIYLHKFSYPHPATTFSFVIKNKLVSYLYEHPPPSSGVETCALRQFFIIIYKKSDIPNGKNEMQKWRKNMEIFPSNVVTSDFITFPPFLFIFHQCLVTSSVENFFYGEWIANYFINLVRRQKPSKILLTFYLFK